MKTSVNNHNKIINKVMEKSQGLSRGMKSRHIMMIAIGGTIGTGLFLGSGYVLQEAGPGGSLLAYGIGGLLMYIMMMCLGELVVAMPVSGSTQAYANELVSPLMGFMSGWIRWLACAVTITSQLVASAIIMKNIIPTIPQFVWIVAFTLVLFLLNLFPSRQYGEIEFWFASIKIITILIFIITALGIVLGIVGGEEIPIINNLKGNWFPGGFKGTIITIMTASFAYGGVDLIASTAGESENPKENLPKTIYKTVFALIAIYILCLFLLSLLLPWQEASLKGSSFAYVFKKAGISSGELIINMIVVTSALSSANTFIYSCTRTLWSLGKHGHAAKVLGKVNKRKVPVSALLISMAFAIVALISSFISADKVYLFLISSIGLSNMFLYGLTCLCQYNFRKIYTKGKNIKLKFKAPLYPILPIVGIILYSLLAIIMLMEPTQRIAFYTGIPTYLGIYFIYRVMTYKASRKDKKCNRENSII